MGIINTEVQNYKQLSEVQKRKYRLRILSRQSATRPGQRRAGDNPKGGGGPENMGAASDKNAAISFYQAQPSWGWEQYAWNDYIGKAAPSNKPDRSGIPSNNFRTLGDAHGGRQ